MVSVITECPINDAHKNLKLVELNTIDGYYTLMCEECGKEYTVTFSGSIALEENK